MKRAALYSSAHRGRVETPGAEQGAGSAVVPEQPAPAAAPAAAGLRGFVRRHDRALVFALGLVCALGLLVSRDATRPKRWAVKAMTHAQLEEVWAEIVLVNYYHLFLRPGAEAVRELGGVHGFMSWPKPVLSDSGGFQIYSLSPLVKVREEGVRFASHLDGTKFLLRPEDVVDIQVKLGADVMICLDHVPPYPSPRETMEASVALTTRWAGRAKAHLAEVETGQQLWAISQGGVFWDLRQRSIEELLAIDFSGYAYGGLGLGEPKALLFEVLERGAGLLPREKSRYLMVSPTTAHWGSPNRHST